MRHPVIPTPRHVGGGARLLVALGMVFGAAWFGLARADASPLLLAGAVTVAATGAAWAASLIGQRAR